MPIKFEVKMTDKVMSSFMLYHTYTHAAGIIGMIIGLLSLGMAAYKITTADYSGALLFFIFSFIFVIYMPFSMVQKAKMQVKHTPMFKKPIAYEIREEGLHVSQDDQEVVNAWEDFRKVVSTGKVLVLYITKIRAVLLPIDQLGDRYDTIVEAFAKYMEPSQIKIRGVK